jgi:DNA-binding MarR family transcriptional regulator
MWDAAHEREVDRLEEQLGVFHRRSRRFLRTFASRVHPGIDAGAYAVLMAIAQAGPRRLNDLAEEFGLDKSTMSRHVSTLIRLGLVDRDPDPVDGRAFLLKPSEDGQRRLDTAAAARRAEWRDRLADWDTADLRSFTTALARMNTDLAPERPERPEARDAQRPTN